jgi:hypothetical protein
MRIIAIGLCALALAAGPALAKQGDPVGGTGVSVESSPGGIVATFNNAGEARNACTAARGTFTSAYGRNVCTNPRTRLRSTRAALPDPMPRSQVVHKVHGGLA